MGDAARAALQRVSPADARRGVAAAAARGNAGVQANAATQPKGTPPSDPQSRLRWAMNLLLGRSVTKEDVVFDTAEVEGGVFQSSCRLPNLPHYSDQVYTGEPAENAKAAEVNAAKIAMDQLEEVVQPVAAEHEAKKKQKEHENKLKHQERLAAKGLGKGGLAPAL